VANIALPGTEVNRPAAVQCSAARLVHPEGGLGCLVTAIRWQALLTDDEPAELAFYAIRVR
jgi:hypothetical protein